MRPLVLLLCLSTMFGCTSSVLRPVEATDAATGLEQVTRQRGDQLDPAISPDGKAVAYTTGEHVDVASLGGRSIYEGRGEHPAWMPDASSIVFVHDHKLVQTFGQGERPVFLADVGDTALGGGVDHPVVSPDGKRVLVSVGGVSVQKPGWLLPRKYDEALGVTDMLGTGLKVIGRGTDPSFSPDGSHIAFAKPVGEHQHVFVANADGTGAVQVTDGANDDESPTFSPDGKRIAFCSIPEEKDHQQANLFEVGTDGQGLVQLTEGDRYACHPSWGRDGYIYFHVNARRHFHIWRLRAR